MLPDDGSAPLVLARADTASLMHNDRVEVLAVGVNDRGRRIARLIRRTADAPARIGGVWHAGHGGGNGRVDPEDPGHWYSVEVAAQFAHGAADGANVIVEITQRPQGEAPAHGRIVEVLEDVRPVGHRGALRDPAPRSAAGISPRGAARSESFRARRAAGGSGRT